MALIQLLLLAVALLAPAAAQDCGGLRDPPCVDGDGNPFCTVTERAGVNGNGVCVPCGNNGRPVCLSAAPTLLFASRAGDWCHEYL